MRSFIMYNIINHSVFATILTLFSLVCVHLLAHDRTNGLTDGMIKTISPILRIGDQVPTFDVFWSKHLQEVRSTVYIHVQSI